jgi:hypothetical protein
MVERLKYIERKRGDAIGANSFAFYTVIFVP